MAVEASPVFVREPDILSQLWLSSCGFDASILMNDNSLIYLDIQPVPTSELSKIITDACDAALKDVTEYEHDNVGTWNSQIINGVLKSLITATAPSESTKPTPYRFTVNSTIVQQGVIDKTAAADGSQSNAGKRGMHSASGAFWDVNRDGMWTFKYPGAEERGLDIVVSVTWFSVN